jgi:hypothetical protein
LLLRFEAFGFTFGNVHPRAGELDPAGDSRPLFLRQSANVSCVTIDKFAGAGAHLDFLDFFDVPAVPSFESGMRM